MSNSYYYSGEWARTVKHACLGIVGVDIERMAQISTSCAPTDAKKAKYLGSTLAK